MHWNVFCAIAHCYAFKADDFKEWIYPLVPPHKVLFDVANVTDLVKDASQHMFKGRKGKRSTASLIGNDDGDGDDDENGDIGIN